MASLSRKEVEHIAELARLRLTEQEFQQFGDQLSSILAYVNTLEKIDTKDISPTTRAADLENVTRTDEVKGCTASTRMLLLEDMPEKAGDLLKVPPVFETQPNDF